MIEPIPITHTIPLDAYRPYEQPGTELSVLRRRGKAIGDALGHGKVWMMNAVRAGGGVAEMLPRVCSLLTELGIDTRWLVLTPGNAEESGFFAATKMLHNLIHGEGPADLEAIRTVYDGVSRRAAEELRAIVSGRDMLIVHDPQPLGVARYLPEDHRPRLVWRCHIGVPHRNADTNAAWRLLAPYLAPYERLLFSAEQYIPDELFDRSGVLHPSIDPLSHKNRDLAVPKLIGILRCAGLIDGPPPPAWACFGEQVRRFTPAGWICEPIPEFLFVPAIVQVSRFDRLKGFDRLIEGFVELVHAAPEEASRMHVNTERALSQLGAIRLILAGPEPRGVVDDPEAEGVLQRLCQQITSLPPEIARRVFLLRLPMGDPRENALIVNALQRAASIIAQCSIQEGFGLTVTEAMWKLVPVVATAVGGISLQVRAEMDGTLIHDPLSAEETGEQLFRVIVDSRRAESMAREAHRRVRSQYLVLNQIAGWLDELERLLMPGAHDDARVLQEPVSVETRLH